jgi:mannitol-specific phosphotransferase system IIBC component
VLLGVAVGAVASFAVGSFILKVYPVKETEEEVAMETSAPLPAGLPA